MSDLSLPLYEVNPQGRMAGELGTHQRHSVCAKTPPHWHLSRRCLGSDCLGPGGLLQARPGWAWNRFEPCWTAASSMLQSFAFLVGLDHPESTAELMVSSLQAVSVPPSHGMGGRAHPSTVKTMAFCFRAFVRRAQESKKPRPACFLEGSQLSRATGSAWFAEHVDTQSPGLIQPGLRSAVNIPTTQCPRHH